MQLHNTMAKAPQTPTHANRPAPRILVVDDETDIRNLLQEILEDEGYSVEVAQDGTTARQLLAGKPIDLILLDIWMPDIDGITLLKEWTDSGQATMPVIIMSGHGTVETAVEATRIGAHDFIEKPLSLAKLLRAVEHALETHRQAGVSETKPLPEPVGKSPLMQALREQLRQVARLDVPVLLQGEAGSGLSLAANYLHTQGQMNGPLIELNIAALDPGQMGAELFGYEKGGEAVAGALERAGTGTLLLSNIEALDTTAQAKLTSAIENKHFTRINGRTVVDLQARLLCATHHSLADRVEQKRFRGDLFYRINIMPITLPPLREHREDVPELLSYYITLYVEQEQLPYRKFSVAAQNRLRNHTWPGNVRELMNLVHRLLITGDSEVISLEEVEAKLDQQLSLQSQATLPIDYDRPLREARDMFERLYFEHQLRKTQGSVGKVAQISGIERTHLYRKLRALGIDPKNISSD